MFKRPLELNDGRLSNVKLAQRVRDLMTFHGLILCEASCLGNNSNCTCGLLCTCQEPLLGNTRQLYCLFSPVCVSVIIVVIAKKDS